MKPKIGILGGTFSPPTLGHLQIGLELLNLKLVHEVWIVPCGDRIDKKIDVTGEERYKMCEILVSEYCNPNVPLKLNDIEIKNGKTIPTYFLMKLLQKDYPDKEFFFIGGTDLLPGLPFWDEGKALLEEINFLLILRTGYPLKPELLPKNYILIESTFVGASSSEARKRIKKYNEKKKGISSQEKNNFKEIHGLDQFSDNKFKEECTSQELDLYHDNYLGVFGILSNGVINYIKRRNLYESSEK